MKFKVVVDDNELLGMKMGSWYGFAWREFHLRRTVLFLIPFNIIIRYAVLFWWYLFKFIYCAHWRNKLDDAYWKGFNEGREERDIHLNDLYQKITKTLRG